MRGKIPGRGKNVLLSLGYSIILSSIFWVSLGTLSLGDVFERFLMMMNSFIGSYFSSNKTAWLLSEI